MPRFNVTGPEPDAIDFGLVVANSPIEALHLLHVEALGAKAVQLVDGQLAFRDPANAEECAGVWSVTAFGPAGSVVAEILIAPAARCGRMNNSGPIRHQDPGRFSSRHMVGWEHRSAPFSGSRPTAILKAGSERSESQSLPSS
jgi:hypothetical protein